MQRPTGQRGGLSPARPGGLIGRWLIGGWSIHHVATLAATQARPGLRPSGASGRPRAPGFLYPTRADRIRAPGCGVSRRPAAPGGYCCLDPMCEFIFANHLERSLRGESKDSPVEIHNPVRYFVVRAFERAKSDVAAHSKPSLQGRKGPGIDVNVRGSLRGPTVDGLRRQPFQAPTASNSSNLRVRDSPNVEELG